MTLTMTRNFQLNKVLLMSFMKNVTLLFGFFIPDINMNAMNFL